MPAFVAPLKSTIAMISIVIPTLNEEEYIAKTLIEIRRQCTDCEIIVVDSQSTDRTVEIAKKYANKVFIGKKHIAFNRNLGASKAKGDIIVSTDADCIPADGWIRRIKASFSSPSVVCVSGQTLPLDGNFLDFTCYFISNIILKTANDFFGIALFRGSNTAFRKSAFLDVGGYNLKKIAREDSEFTKRISKKGKTVFNMRLTVLHSMRRRKNMGWIQTLRYYIDTPISMLTGKEFYHKV